ncbi:hypothetical protein CCR75_001195 [Bremia lactucae]|uniref:DNA-(apurinic or apyrimidinic site) endonuclease 2 n=1 Tax=Bremia lactucae TaxID=4779 RepID=A0A976FQK7_BRELC|nr:hypothetical protein CCR75_001195 [Bremia lactucae]
MKQEVKFVTWNINGLRAVLQRLNQNLHDFLTSLDADIICLQETKMTRSELDEEFVRPRGFDAFYSFCRHRGGYSGVVTFVKSNLPTIAAEEGLTGLWQTEDSVGHVGSMHYELPSTLVKDLEGGGRCVITDHQSFLVLNTYCPALASAERLEYKLYFHKLLQDRVDTLRAAKKPVIVVVSVAILERCVKLPISYLHNDMEGDINIAHQRIDHCDPQANDADCSFEDHPCRKWMNSFVEVPVKERNKLLLKLQRVDNICKNTSRKLVDLFRHFHPDQTKAFTVRNSSEVELKSLGVRFNYNERLLHALLKVLEHANRIDSNRLGSDHCPEVMSCVVDFASTKNSKTTALCARNYVEFSGTQQSIKSFIVQRDKLDIKSCTKEAFGSSNLLQKKAKRGQQSISSFLTQTGTKRKSHMAGEEIRSKIGSASHRTFNAVHCVDPVASKKSVEEWGLVLSGRPPPTPICFCGQPSIIRSVIKTGENRGRKFYVCTKPAVRYLIKHSFKTGLAN